MLYACYVPYLVMPRLVLSPCYMHVMCPTLSCLGLFWVHFICMLCAHMGYKWVCNILLGMSCEITSAKHGIFYEVTSAKHAWVSLEKIWMDGGQMGRLEEKNRSSNNFVLTAFISFGLFNNFHEMGYTNLIIYGATYLVIYGLLTLPVGLATICH